MGGTAPTYTKGAVAQWGDFHQDVPVRSLSIIVPCLNERENLEALISRVSPVLEATNGELVLVDDGSSDGSFELLQAQAQRHSRLVLRRHETNSGIPTAWNTGSSASQSEWVASLDADLQYDPEDVVRLLAFAQAHQLDFVQGARERVESEGVLRQFLSRGLNAALNFTFATDALDHKSALFVCRKSHLERLLEHRHHFSHWQCFIGVSARALGLRCGELKVPFRRRARGTSAFGAIPWKSTLEVLTDFGPALRLYGWRQRWRWR